MPGKKRYLYLILILLLIPALSGCGSSEDASFDAYIESAQEAQRIAEEEINEHSESAGDSAERSAAIIEETSNSEYDTIIDTFSRPSDEKRSISEQLLYYFYIFYYMIRKYAFAIALIGWIIGLPLFFFAKGNRALQRFGLLDLGIGVTILMLLIVFAPAIKKMFMG